jgi:hypothetical protein
MSLSTANKIPSLFTRSTRRAFLTLLTATLCCQAFADATNTAGIVWAGLDFSMVRIICPKNYGDVNSVFPEMAGQWNRLVVRDRLKALSTALRQPVKVDVSGVNARNESTSGAQISVARAKDDGTNNSHITRQQIEDAVRSYKLESTQGRALVFIVDRFVQPSGAGALYVVFFDVATRNIISCDRQVHHAGGDGFRNYWFGVIKRALDSLGPRP